MLEHPGTELQLLIKDKGLTQKAFASILGKKVSEVNELLKGKRNITIQRDYLLHQTLGTPMKYWILKQVDYDYSLLDVEESSDSSLPKQGEQNEVSLHNNTILSDSEVYSASGESTTHENRHSECCEASSEYNDRHSEPEGRENPSNTTPMDFSFQSKGQTNTQETPVQETKNEDDEDFKKRARIFKSF